LVIALQRCNDSPTNYRLNLTPLYAEFFFAYFLLFQYKKAFFHVFFMSFSCLFIAFSCFFIAFSCFFIAFSKKNALFFAVPFGFFLLFYGFSVVPSKINENSEGKNLTLPNKKGAGSASNL